MNPLDVALKDLSPEQRDLVLLRLGRRKREQSVAASAAAEPAGDPIPRLAVDDPVVLSFGQERLWFLARLDPGGALYHMPAALRLRGRLNVPALRAAVAEIVRRHAVLRTTFDVRQGMPVQVIHPACDVPVPLVDLRALPVESREGESARLGRAEAARPFDLAAGPLLRATLLWQDGVPNGDEVGELGEYRALLTLHHIVADGWSMGPLVRDLGVLYASGGAGRPSLLPPLSVQYADFAAWQRRRLSGTRLDDSLAYWQRRLAGVPTLELPADRPRPAVQSFRGDARQVPLSTGVVAGLARLSREVGGTPFMVLLAGFAALLARLSGQRDVAVGSPIAGRSHPDLEELIGFFVNTLVLRMELAAAIGPASPAFRVLVERARDVAVGAFAHQELPFERLVEELVPQRSLAVSPLFQAMLSLHHAPRAVELAGLAVEPLAVSGRAMGVEAAKFDLILNFIEVAPGRALGEWIFSTDLFDRTTVARWAGHFETLLEAAFANPGAPFADLPLLAAAELHQLRTEWNPGLPGEAPTCNLAVAFERQVSLRPQAVALSQGGIALSYGELDRRANRLARHLLACGLQPSAPVALSLERSLDLVMAVVAVLKAGGVYVPLDPTSPGERSAFVLADCGAALLLTVGAGLAALSEVPAEVRVILLDDGAEATALARHVATSPGLRLPAASPAYVIYTSGSTGRPKGVRVSHANVSRLLTATDPWFAFGPQDVWTLFHSYAFDFSVWEMWGCLLTGGRLVVVPYWLSRSPHGFRRLLAEEGVTVLNQTPSAFRQLVWAEQAALDGGESRLALSWVLFGGEALDLSSLVPWWERYEPRRPLLVNLYGITETTVHVTYREVSPADLGRGTSPVGRPIPDLAIYLLDAGLRPVPIGVAGEICVGGAGLALGYAGRPEATAERFVPDPLGEAPGGRLYRSGDLARRRADGDLDYIGRRDHQVKMRGFRIELGEIEAALARHPKVRGAVVLAHGEGEERSLAAYVVPEGELAPTLAELREAASGWLPDYMLPTVLVPLASFPLTANGKVDRGALLGLSVPEPADGGPAAYAEPRSELERFLAGLWAATLKVERIGLDDSFFAQGGNSIRGALLINQLQEALGEIVHVVAIFDAPSVRQMAAYLMSHHREAVLRRWGAAGWDEAAASGSGGEPVRQVDEARIARLAGMIPPLAPFPEEGKNPRAVFVLSPPRSGSTLLRVLLAGHPQLFAPPELELLSFNTLDERARAFSGRDRFWREGLVRAVMEVLKVAAGEAEEKIGEAEREGLSTHRFYGRLQGWLGERLLVDKTPSYALDPAILARAEQGFDRPLYIHLLRHPYGMIRSFEEARLDQIFFRRPHPFSRRELAELLWTVSHRNIEAFLQGLPAERQVRVRFEDLVRAPEKVLDELCQKLSVPYLPAMADPYRDPRARMTDGPHAESRMLGDVKLLQHSRIDPEVAERWREGLAGDFLGTPTWEMAERLGYPREERGWQRIAPRPVRDGERLPLSYSQERLWFLDQLDPGRAIYNVPAALRLRGRLVQTALAAGLAEVVRRHSVLRVTLSAVEGRPFQQIQAVASPQLPEVDLRSLPARRREAEARRLAAAEAEAPFDLARGPLLRASLLRLGDGDHVLLLTLHHIVADGWSMGVLIRELGGLYRSAVAGRPSPLAPLPLQYTDYAAWQREWLRGAALDEQIAFWRGALADAAPLLELPTDRPRPAVRTYRGSERPVRLAAPLACRLAELGRARGASPFMTLLAGLAALLSRWSAAAEVVVGSPVAGRHRAEVEGLIGFFVNTLALRVDTAGAPGFGSLVERAREVALRAFSHGDLPFERLVEELQPQRNLAHSPLFQVMFALQNAEREPIRLPGLTLELLEVATRSSKFDLILQLSEGPGGELSGHWAYSTDLFDATTLDRLAGRFVHLLDEATAAPERPLQELPWLTAPERQALVVEWSAPLLGWPREGPEGLLHAAVADRGAAFPDRVAVLAADEHLTYGELLAASGRLAGRLQAAGVRPERVVGAFLERGLDLPVALLGILEAGGAYLPLDPSYPHERLAYMLEDASGGPDAAVLVTQERLLSRLPDVPVFRAARRIVLAAEPGPAPPRRAPVPAVVPDNAAYVIYTSGSTGRPKGVVIAHRAATQRVLYQAAVDLPPGGRMLQKTPISFDVSVLEIFAPLLAGGATVLAPPESQVEPAVYLRRIAEGGVDQASFPPSTLAVLLEDDAFRDCPSLRQVVTGGEAVPAYLARRFRERSSAELLNRYGPTETTISVTSWSCSPEDHRAPPIGRPLAGARIYLLDSAMGAVPLGVAGEIFVGGACVARGYRGRPELTAERFLPDPFAAAVGAAGARLYRTGDLGRFRADGAVEFVGRVDGQVKVRGFRVEVGEVEAALATHPGIHEAAVVAEDERDSRRRLVAFVVARDAAAPSAGELREHLGVRLPAYMIPSAYVFLSALPLTPSGKIDRRALAATRPAAEAAMASATAGPEEVGEPLGPVEEILAGIWRELLERERVGPEDDFFALGGHSLLATQLVSRVRGLFAIELPLRAVFEAPTLSALARRIELAFSTLPAVGAALERRPQPDTPSPLSFAQERLWFLDQMEPGNPAYNMPIALELSGDLDRVALAATLGELVRRHQALRTIFTSSAGGAPQQVVQPASEVGMPLVDLTALPAPEAEARHQAGEEAQRHFDLALGPLLRVRLLCLAERRHIVLFTLHHIVSDAWSMGVLVREVGALYEAALSRRPSPLGELAIQYADFSAWQRRRLSGDALAGEVRAWRGRLAGAPFVLELPADRPRSAVQGRRGGVLSRPLPQELAGVLRERSRGGRLTPFMVLLAVFEALLYRLTGRTVLLVGSTIANRTQRELEGLIGFFVNTLVLRADPAPELAFETLLAQAREAALFAYAHQELPFERLVEELRPERDLSRSPLVQVLFQLQNAPMPELRLTGLRMAPVAGQEPSAKFDLVLNASSGDGAWSGAWRYNADLFDRSTVARMAGHFSTLLAAALAAPARRLADLPLLSAGEAHQIVTEWNEGPPADLARCGLYELFLGQATQRPDACALAGETGRLSYGELATRANRLARHLVALGAGPGHLVGLCLERSADLVLAILGVLAAGAAYVPLDPDYPKERLGFVLADSGMSLLLTRSALGDHLPDLPPGLGVVDLDTVLGGPGRRLGAAGGEALPVRAAPEDLAYVIYTSGSTGRPKGVGVRHGEVARLLGMTERWFGFGPEDVWTLFHSYAFDFSVWELWGCLAYGGRLVVVPYWTSRSPEAFRAELWREQVTVLNQTPSAFRQLLQAEAVALEEGAGELALRYVIFGGEALDIESLVPWWNNHDETRPRLVNMYGITETTVHVTYRALGREDLGRGSGIGRPIPDLSVRLLDGGFAPVPIGVAGEIHVGGAGLALGYLGLPERTAERFVPDPWARQPGARLYRSGDLARLRTDGALEYLGRIDHQVKVRGFRIELGEIESALVRHPAVREAVILVRGETGGERLVAYLTVAPGESPELGELRHFVGRWLPDYMLPSGLVLLAALPLTPSGKVDRGALLRHPTGEADGAVAPSSVAPRTALERALFDLWRASLQSERFGIHDDFFALGGNSISGAVLINRLQAELGEIVHVVAIFDAPTIAELAAYLVAQHRDTVVRRWGVESLGIDSDALPAGGPVRVTAERAAELRSWVRPLVPAAAGVDAEEPAKNPRAIFILSPPRSGSTLLRVMLGGHPRLFAPPELELLSFRTLAERREVFSGRDSFWLEGTLRAVMAARGCTAEEAAALVAEYERAGLPTRRLYGILQSWLGGGRTLVDKTPSYALDPAVLARAEEEFTEPFYVHLVRHPHGMIRSFEEAKLDQIFFRRGHPFGRRELAELIWLVSHRNIVEFLGTVPPWRQHWVRFEELTRDPEGGLRSLCSALGLSFEPAMARPYEDRQGRMTDGLHAESRMLGDVKFHEHRGVEREVAERWRSELAADFLGDPTWELAAALGYPRLAAAETATALARRLGDAPVALSFAQERLWFLDQLDPGSAAYNIPAALELHGRLDVAALTASLAEIVRRHEALRTVFRAGPREGDGEGAGRPVQLVGPPVALAVPLADLSALPTGVRTVELARLVRQEARRGFDLAEGPLLRVALLRLEERRHAALLTMHHIVSDGWSMGVLIRELGALYSSWLEGRSSPLPDLEIQYPDFALWQRRHLAGETLARELAYWRQSLDGLATLELPTDRPRPPLRRGRGGLVRFGLPADVARELARRSRGAGATLFMTLLAGFVAVLSRLTGQDDVAVGTPIANRTRREIEALIGFFVNTLVLRTRWTGDPAFPELLAAVRQTALEAFRHQEVPFERVVEELAPRRDPSRTPLFQVLFTLQNPERGTLELPGLTLAPIPSSGGTAKFDLTLSLGEGPSGMLGTWEYDRDLFEATTVERLAGHFVNLLGGGEETPLSALPLLSPGEHHQVLREWAGGAVEYAREDTLYGVFSRQAARAPAAVAVVSGGVEAVALSYGELARQANWLAHHLSALGVGPDVLVGLCLERSIDWTVACLAILAAGGAYVPLDPAYPRQRLTVLTAGVAAVVTAERWRELLPPGIPVVCLDRERTAPSTLTQKPSSGPPSHPCSGGEAPPATGVAALNLAYVLFTSGSTGVPKAVAIPHRAVLRLVLAADYAEFGRDRVFLQLAPLSFDASTLEVWGPLLHGGCLVVPAAGILSLEEVEELLARHGVTTLWLTAGLFHEMAASNLRGLAPVRELLVGGDVVSAAHARRVLAELPGTRLINGYGPTESTTFAACCPLRDAGEIQESVPIGRPISNTRLVVVDRGFRPVPAGVPGELLIGGDGLARGYLDAPDWTAERFLPSLWEAGERVYRTGDRARFAATGRLEFLGRIDGQVKVRGFRIEPGEVETALAGHPAVRQVVVIAREDPSGGRRLVAYVVPRGPVDELPETLRRYAAEHLPAYLVPAVCVPLALLPLSPSGKVDRAALPAPNWQGGAAYEPPRTPIEEVLAGIWQAVLGGGRVGSGDDFFALGGHSLLATQVASRIREAFEVELPLRALFEAPTLAGLAREIEAAQTAGRGTLLAPPCAVERDGPLPLSFAQERLWFLDQLHPGSAAYNIAVALRLHGRLDRRVFQASLREIVRRHESLRTTFGRSADGPVQVVVPKPAWSASEVDLRSLPEAVRSGELARLVNAEAGRPFDLARGPLLRVVLALLGEGEHAVLLTMHHAISDGWSMQVLVSELGAIYGAWVAGRPSPLPELALQYPDFAAWQRRHLEGEVLTGQLAYWREALADLPVVEVPGDRPRPPVRRGRGGAHRFRLPQALTEKLEGLSRSAGSTLFITLFAALAALLSRLTGQDDLAVGTPIANRNRREIEGLIGFFVNILVLRARVPGDPTFREVLAMARRTALAGYQNQDVPFERLVEELSPGRDPSRTPLFQVMFAVQNLGTPRLDLPGLTLETLPSEERTAKFDFGLSLSEGPVGLVGGWEYDRDLFEPTTLMRWSSHFAAILHGVVTDSSLQLSELPLLAPAERQQLLMEWRGQPAALVGGERCLHELFALQASLRPDAVAVLAGGASLTYGELARRSASWARRLRSLGVGAEARVGLHLERSLDLVIAILAVLRAGGAYVPLDPALPPQRLKYLLADSAAGVLLTRGKEGASLASRDVRVVFVDGIVPGTAEADPGSPVLADGLAYVIYTSGSTGVPNGVLLAHRGAVNLILSAITLFDAGPDRLVLQVASPGFDASVLEIFVALGSGACLCLAGEEERLNPDLLASLLLRQGVNLAMITPAQLALLPEPDLGVLETLALGGDACAEDLAARWVPGRRIFNAYGPTEATIFATAAPLRAGRAAVIGRPVPNLEAHALGATMSPLPIGGRGELWLAGAGLARGYLGRPELTAMRFLPDPFSRTPGGRLYHTGDLARRRPDGNLEFLGRRDNQIKLRGVRIELGEIEAVLAGHPQVLQVAVLARVDRPGDRRLVAYIVMREPREELALALRAFAMERLPVYLVPVAFVALDALPLTRNGKLDRVALPAPKEPDKSSEEALRTPVEEVLAGIWQAVLGGGRVGGGDDFFALGGHSLLATQVASRIREAFEVELPLRALFEAPTLAGLAREIEAAQTAGRGPVLPPPCAVERDGPLPLSFAQERLWFLDQLHPGSAAYNIAIALRLHGPLDRRVFQASLREIVRRHESLRTTFGRSADRPVQVVVPEPAWSASEVDLGSLPESLRPGELARLVNAEAGRPFDLARGPLLRVVLALLGEGKHAALVAMHHAISDGWSMQVLVGELGAIYGAWVAGRPSPLPELALQYPDFAEWQRRHLAGEVLTGQLAYWREALADLPVVELRGDRPRPPVRGGRAGVLRFRLPEALTEGLERLSRGAGSTLFITLFAALAALLSRLTGQEDVVVGTPIANRNRREIEGLIGFFVNTLVLRTRLLGDPTFREVLAVARRAALSAYQNQDVPFERLVAELSPERDPSRPPLFRVMFALQNMGTPRLDLPGLTLEAIPSDFRTAKFDLNLSLSESESGLLGGWEYDRDLFDPTTIERLSRSWTRLLAGVVAAPEQPFWELPVLEESERHQLVAEWGGAPTAYPRDRTIAELFAAQVKASQEAVALDCEGRALSYGELDRRAESWADRLRALGVGVDTRVGLCLERSLDWLVGCLAILKAGGGYVPLDPSYPRERLALLSAGTAVVLTTERWRGTLPGATTVVSLDGEPAAPLRLEPMAPVSRATAESLAYVLYTSGSTGIPRGVAIPHRGVVRLIAGADYAELGREQVFLQLAPLSFDASTFEIWGSLLTGGRLVIPSPERLSLADLATLLERHGVTTLWLTSGLFQQMVDENLAGLSSVRQLLAGGDVLSVPHVRRLLAEFPGMRLVNGYGPTESTTFACCFTIRDARDLGSSVPLGRPIANTSVFVVDRALRAAPVGVAGELAIAGDGLGRGYIDRPEWTAERFVPNAFGDSGSRLYRTGDLARWSASGHIEFLGRMDQQVKVRGYRIEPGEVEAVLGEHPAVRAVAVVARADRSGDRRLVAYVVGRAGEEGLAAALRAFMAERLPAYLVPAGFVVLDALPLSANGKLDRSALPAPDWQGNAAYEVPRTPVEEVLAEIWQRVLRCERVGIRDDFFALGGHSLLATQVMARVRATFKIEIPLSRLFDQPTIETLAVAVLEAESVRGRSEKIARALGKLRKVKVDG
jgi:amino acid adenylation domain-containing protein